MRNSPPPPWVTLYLLCSCHTFLLAQVISNLCFVNWSLGSTAYTTSTSKTASKKNTTFITVSDIPMELSKQLQAILHTNQRTGNVLRKALPNIDQYNYDFSLERAVISSLEGISWLFYQALEHLQIWFCITKTSWISQDISVESFLSLKGKICGLSAYVTTMSFRQRVGLRKLHNTKFSRIAVIGMCGHLLGKLAHH